MWCGDGRGLSVVWGRERVECGGGGRERVECGVGTGEG